MTDWTDFIVLNILYLGTNNFTDSPCVVDNGISDGGTKECLKLVYEIAEVVKLEYFIIIIFD